MADAEFNIVIGVQNRERIKELQDDIDRAEREIVKLSASMQASGAATAQQNSQLQTLGATIRASRQEIESLSKANIALGESAGVHGGRGAAMGILALSQAIDDAQYGFRAIVNNIPQVIYMMGGGAGLAGVVGIAAVAVNVLINHWADLQSVFAKTEGIDQAKSSLEALASWLQSQDSAFGDLIGGAAGGKLEQFTEWLHGRAEVAKHTAITAQRAKRGEDVINSPTAVEEDRGKAFTEAVKAYGGKRLHDEMLERDIAGKTLTPSQRDTHERRVQEFVGKGAVGLMKPDENVFGAGFTQEFEKQQAIQNRKELDKEDKHRYEEEHKKIVDLERNALVLRAAEKKMFEEREKDAKDLTRANQRVAVEGKEEELRKLERQKRDYGNFMREHPEPTFSTQRGGQAIAESIQADLMNSIPKRQLKVQEAMQAGIDKVKDELVALRVGGIPGRVGR